MITIKEMKSGNEIYFQKEISTKNGISISNKIHYQAIIKELNGFTYLIIYDTNMKPISEAFGFLNFDKSAQSINSRIKSMQALKLLYCYQDIISKQLKGFSTTDITNLKWFLKGVSPKGQNITFEIDSSRNNQTINGYLSIYRQYLVFLGYDNKYLAQKSNKKVLIAVPDKETELSVTKFKANEKIPNKVIEVPRYISVKEFTAILNVIRKEYSLREEIIVRIMYQCGLRIGEVLGLTSDDVLMEQVEDDYVPFAYIRNRTTDRADQMAKTCMKVVDVKQYKSKEYRTKGFGYQFVVLPQDIYDLINEYIELAHTNARQKHHEGYYTYTIADRVRKSEEYEDDNYYIFINSVGKPLLSHSWNNIIREIFRKCNIPIDKGKREHNLNHRFRHGFAMFNVQHLGCREVELKERMRHASILSVASYFHPTISDSIKVKTEFAESLYQIIPLLKKE